MASWPNSSASLAIARLTLIQFDDQCEVVFAARPVTQAPRLTEDTFQPRGCTALRDAIGRTIDGTGARLAALSEDERPDRVMGGHHHRRAGEREHRLHSRARDRHDLDAAGRVQLVVPVSRGESGRDRGRRKDGHRRPPECELRRNGCWSTRDVSKGVRGGVSVRITREDVPASVRASVELQSACPASAVVMRRVGHPW